MDSTSNASSSRLGPGGVFVLMARGTLEEIRTRFAKQPEASGEIREIGRALVAAGVEPDWGMVRKLLRIMERAIREAQAREAAP